MPPTKAKVNILAFCVCQQKNYDSKLIPKFVANTLMFICACACELNGERYLELLLCKINTK